MSNPATGKRIYGLDILRAIAIAYVMHWHGQHFLDPHLPYRSYAWLVLDGVDLFFVLSGFLIGGILLRTIAEKPFTMKTLWQFWIRRWFRTLPNYFLVLVFLLVTYQLFREGLPQYWYRYFFFTQNLVSPHPVFFSEAWSLSVEEWFYLLVPLGLYLLLSFTNGNKQKVILSWILFVIVTVTLYRIYKISNLQPGDNYSLHVRRQVLTRLDSIMYGVLGAYVSFYYRQAWPKNTTAFFVLGLIIIFATRIWSDTHIAFAMYWQPSLMASGILFLLPKLTSVKTGRGFTFRSLTLISLISYSMYLLNHRIDVVVTAMFKKAGIDPHTNFAGGIAAYIAFWLLTIISSYLLYRFFELPIMRLRDRFKQPAEQKSMNAVTPDV